MNISNQSIHQLARQYGNSFYVIKTTEFEENYIEFSSSFKSYYSNIRIGYSYKTNYIPYLCKKANELGAYAEVVSELELTIAEKLAIPYKNIIYNGPIKPHAGLETCLLQGARVNIDNLHELYVVQTICAAHQAISFKIGLRINLDLHDNFQSRFGFDPSTNDFKNAIELIKATENLFLVGLHTHSTRPDKSVESYLSKLEGLIHLSKELIEPDELEYLDIGGGYYGKMDSNIRAQFTNEPIAFSAYGKGIGSLMDSNFPNHQPELILEPGVAMTVNVLDFICQVDHVKKIGAINYATVSGSFHNVKPTAHKKNLTLSIRSATEEFDKRDNQVFQIVGYTCLENDVLYENYNGRVQEGDYLQFENVGAYTLVFKPPFIKSCPPILAFENDTFELVCREESFEDIFNRFQF